MRRSVALLTHRLERLKHVEARQLQCAVTTLFTPGQCPTGDSTARIDVFVPVASPAIRNVLAAAVRRVLSPRWYQDIAFGHPPPQHLHVTIAEQRTSFDGIALARFVLAEIEDATEKLKAESTLRADPLAAVGQLGLSPSLDILGRAHAASGLPAVDEHRSLEEEMEEMRLWATSITAPPRPVTQGPQLKGRSFSSPSGRPLQSAFALMQNPNLQRRATLELCADAALPSLVEDSRAANRAAILLLSTTCVSAAGEPVCGIGSRVAARTASDAKAAVHVLVRSDQIQSAANAAIAATAAASFKPDVLAPAWLLAGGREDAQLRDFLVRTLSKSVPSLTINGRLNEKVKAEHVTAFVSEIAAHTLDSVKEVSKLRTEVEQRVWSV